MNLEADDSLLFQGFILFRIVDHELAVDPGADSGAFGPDLIGIPLVRLYCLLRVS